MRASMASGRTHAIGVGLVGLFVIGLLVSRDPVLGQALDPDAVGGATQLPRGVPQPSATPEATVPQPSASADASAAPVATQTGVSRIVAATFYSEAMRMQRPIEIYLPPSYEQAPDRTYPVLYLLHGDDGRVDAWVSLGIRAKLDQAIVSGGPELIVVMPDGSGHFGDETDWANRWDGSDPIEDQVIEVVNFVDASFRTVPDRSARFIGGLSSGGFGSLNLALHHPDLFSTAMSFSGFIAADDREADPGVFGEDRAYIERNSPAALVTSELAARDIYYILSGGRNDPYFQNRMAQFSAQLDRLGIAHEFHIVPGGHDGIAWDAGLDFGLAYLGSQLRDTSGPTVRSSE